jgi:hypothetical protein
MGAGLANFYFGISTDKIFVDNIGESFFGVWYLHGKRSVNPTIGGNKWMRFANMLKT